VSIRDLFLEVALFGNPEKIPLAIWGIRPATRRRWINEGLPENENPIDYLGIRECILRMRGITTFPQEGFEWTPDPSSINIGPLPPFKHRIIREDERYRFWIDCLGITQMGFRDDWKNGWSGFATRVFIEFPVKNRRDFLEIKKRYDPKDPRRYPKNWGELVRAYRRRDYPLGATIRGPFWWTRDMIGLKGIAVGIHREPEFIEEIMDFCADFHIEVLHRALDDLDLDFVLMSEDMAYKKGPMISPDAVRKYMGSAYKRMIKFFRDHSVKVIGIDSDGNIEPLIPIWLEFGINWITPCEVAAGMDVVKLGESYPRLVMSGGIDKRELAKDRRAIENEVMHRVPPLIERRGYFPGVDHAVPPDVSFKNFKYFVSLLKEICGWTK